MILQKLNGPERGKTHELKQGDNRVGRAPESDIVVLDRTVSSSHVTLALIGDAVTARDHSKNGTFVNDKRITEASLQPGDRIRVGMTELQLLVQPAAEDEPTVVAGPEDRTEPHQVVARPAPVAAARPALKKGDSGPYQAAAQPHQAAKTPEGGRAAGSKPSRPPNKTRRLMLVGGLALLAILGVLWLLQPPRGQEPRRPRPRPPQPQNGSWFDHVPQGMQVDVTMEYGRINLGACSESVKTTLERGKEYYVGRGVPGRCYNAGLEWSRAYPTLSGADAQALANCLYTVKMELTRSFHDESVDIEIRILQTPLNYVALKSELDGIVGEFPDAYDPRRAWAKQKLNNLERRRKK